MMRHERGEKYLKRLKRIFNVYFVTSKFLYVTCVKLIITVTENDKH